MSTLNLRVILRNLIIPDRIHPDPSLLMPRSLFGEAAATAGSGLEAVITMATLCEMSLTSTAMLLENPRTTIAEPPKRISLPFALSI